MVSMDLLDLDKQRWRLGDNVSPDADQQSAIKSFKKYLIGAPSGWRRSLPRDLRAHCILPYQAYPEVADTPAGLQRPGRLLAVFTNKSYAGTVDTLEELKRQEAARAGAFELDGSGCGITDHP